MSRRALVLGQIVDIWGDTWDLREFRVTSHGFTVSFGWPAEMARGRGGSGGPRVVMTEPLEAYLRSCARACTAPTLPIGATTLKRLRALLGLHVSRDRSDWWAERIDDLEIMTLEDFSERHGVSPAATSIARSAAFGRSNRPSRWWCDAKILAVILDYPTTIAADELECSASGIRRMRSLLRQAFSNRRRRVGKLSIEEAIRLRRDHTLEKIAAEAGVSLASVSVSLVNLERTLARLATGKTLVSKRGPMWGRIGRLTKELAVSRIQGGASFSDVAKEAGVAVETVYGGLRRARQEGLIPFKRRAKSRHT